MFAVLVVLSKSADCLNSVVVNTVFQAHDRECHTNMTDQTNGSDLSCHPTGTQMMVSRTAETGLPPLKTVFGKVFCLRLIHSEDTLNFTARHGSRLLHYEYESRLIPKSFSC